VIFNELRVSGVCLNVTSSVRDTSRAINSYVRVDV